MYTKDFKFTQISLLSEKSETDTQEFAKFFLQVKFWIIIETKLILRYLLPGRGGVRL